MQETMPVQILRIPADDPLIIAPCGINCSLCRAYIRAHTPCPGCRGDTRNKSNSCIACTIKNCPERASGKPDFCFTCKQFPCAALQHLDQRYRTRYGVSVIANLERIRTAGLDCFLREEAGKWSCPGCGSRLCMHESRCLHCGHTRQAV